MNNTWIVSYVELQKGVTPKQLQEGGHDEANEIGWKEMV
jgi:hypothetical protein